MKFSAKVQQHARKKLNLPSRIESEFAQLMKRAGLSEGMVAQYVAVEGRKFPWDFAWPGKRLLVEIHGGVFSRGPSAHNTGVGVTRDCRKLNCATVAGFTSLAFTGEMVSTEQEYVIESVRLVLERLK